MIINMNMSSGAVGVNLQNKTATSSFSNMSITPDAGYDALARVDVAAMPMTTVENASGGLTVTIGGNQGS